MSNFSLRSHASSDRRKWAAVTIAILFIIAVIVTGVLTDWFTNWNKYCLFGHDYDVNGVCTRCGEEKSDDIIETISDQMIINDVTFGKGLAVSIHRIPRAAFEAYGIMSIAESAQQITATVQPSDATDQTVDWSIAWTNAASDWATGKTATDYVTVTPTQDGALTANVQCLQPFAEQMIITCTSRDDTSKSATCTVDYKKKVTAVETSFSIAGMGGTFVLKSDGSTEGNGMPFGSTFVSGPPISSQATVTYSIGTIENEAVPGLTIEFDKFARGYAGSVKCNTASDVACQQGRCGHYFRTVNNVATYSDVKDFKPTLDIINHLCVFNSGVSLDPSWGKYCFSRDDTFDITITCDTWTKTYSNLSFDQSVFKTSVQSVGGLSDIVF